MQNAEGRTQNEKRAGKQIVVKALVFVFFVVFASGAVSAEDKKLTGKQIAKMADEANHSEKGIVQKGVMELIDMKSGDTEKRGFKIIGKTENGKSMSMFRFTDSSYRGTTFLTIDREDSDLMYIYLESIGSPRQVEGSDKESKFVDTDISNEDMSGGAIGEYTYKRLDDRKIAGFDCYVIERYPEYEDTKYSKHLTILTKKHLIAVAMKSYSREGRLVKTIKQGDIVKISEGLYAAKNTEVTDVKEKHKTALEITDIEEKNIPAGYFNKNRMDRRWGF